MPKIFISYRREDTSGHAGRLYADLIRALDRDSVFMDIDSLAPGEDFPTRIEQTIGASDVALIVIGSRWLTSMNDQGQRRLDDPADWVRRETDAALHSRARVVPVLVQDARM